MNYEDRVTKEYVEGKLAECGNCKIYTGSYVGTGTYGENNPNTLTFPFEPKFVWVGVSPTGGGSGALLWHEGISVNYQYTYEEVINISQSGNTLSWYNTKKPEYQYNKANSTYYYLILG